MSPATRGSRLSKVTLAAGFVALLLGTLVAYGTPARGYELSIYDGTPAAYWAGIAVALGASLVVAMAHTESRLERDAALLLGGATTTNVVLLPLIRGYYQFGSGDALTHLGWTRDILAGRLEPVDMLYPGIHTMTIFTAKILGARLGRSQMLVMAAFVVVFFLFVTLCVRMLGRAEWAVPVGAFSAFLIVPNNNVGIHLMGHPITQSLLLLPFVLYLLLRYVDRNGESIDERAVGTSTGALLGLAVIATVLVHPQGALNVVAIFVAVALVQFLARRFRSDGPVAGHRAVYGPTAVAVVAFLLWAPRHQRVQRTVNTVVGGLMSGANPANEVAQRSSSLEILGAGIVGLFGKLFLVSAVFSVLAGLLMATWYFGALDDRYPERNALLTYVVVALAPLTAAFAAFFLASLSTQYFRYVGFLMVPVTVLGALAVSAGAARLRPRLGDRRVAVALVVGFLLLFPVPLATMHASPFIYQPTQDVTEMQIEGTTTTVEYADRDVPFAGIRAGPRRLIDATRGTVGSSRLPLAGERAVIPERVFDRSNLTAYYESRRYVPVSRSDYQQEVVLYEGFRYDETGFEQLRASSGVDRVHTNGEYRLYLVGNGSSS